MVSAIMTSISCNGKKRVAGFFNKPIFFIGAVLCFGLQLASVNLYAQPEASVIARMDARQIMVGDQARLFIEVRNRPSLGRVEWASIPDTFNTLEIVERGKIDTINVADTIIYKQRLLITGFDSGVYKVPSFKFPVIATDGEAYVAETDSFELLVQTVAVDTTKAFMPIKDIVNVPSSWKDYIWYIVAGVLFIIALVIGIIYFLKRKKPEVVVPEGPKETIQEEALRLLAELEARQLWQNENVKEYYVLLTDIIRSYLEARFNTPVMELTTDELLQKAKKHRELLPYHAALSVILPTADLAKFAKAQPLPQEHIDALDKAREIIINSTPVIVETPTEETT